jgi:hypothetical protein
VDLFSDLVALAALSVTGLPKLRDFLKRPKLRVITAQRCTVQHYGGKLHLWLILDIQNLGGRPTTITSIDVRLKRDGQLWKLPAEMYSPQDIAGRIGALIGQPLHLLIGAVTLQPGEHWRELVSVYDTAEDEKELNELDSAMQADIAKKREVKPEAERAAALIEVDPKLLAHANQFFASHFKLTASNYTMYVAVAFDEGKRLDVTAYTFTLWDENIRELRGFADNYKFGLTYAHSKGATLGTRLKSVAAQPFKLQSEYDKLNGA